VGFIAFLTVGGLFTSYLLSQFFFSLVEKREDFIAEIEKPNTSFGNGYLSTIVR
jgi:hypothetical protein